jgi:hypothetical protein
MGNIRLGIKYLNWGVRFIDLNWGTPVITAIAPENVGGGLVNNWENEAQVKQTYNVKYAKATTVADTSTETFTSNKSFSLSVGYQPGSTGGPKVDVTVKLDFGKSTTNGHTDTTTTTIEETQSFEKIVPPYSRMPYSALLSKAQYSAPYTAIIESTFSVMLIGFLRWGGGDPESPGTNYHKDWAGSGKRPMMDEKTPEATFGGNDGRSFAEDLLFKSANRVTPWQWERLFRQHPDVQGTVNQLCDTSTYQFIRTGRIDITYGTRLDIEYGAIEHNPAHPIQKTQMLTAMASGSGANVSESMAQTQDVPIWLSDIENV